MGKKPESGIAFDFDGVICDAYNIFRGHYFDMFGHNMEPEDEHERFEFDIVNNPHFEDWWWKEIPVAIAQYQHVAPPTPGSVEALRAFYIKYGEVVIITAREPSDAVMQVTKLWCDKVFDFPYEIHFVASSHEKKKEMLRLGIRHYVDDRFKTAVNLSEILHTSFLFNRPWNGNRLHGMDNIKRVDTLWQMKEILDLMESPHA
jgi:phosphoglycolate phosphatase-like HAD superfamily hydrolase